MNDRPPRGQLPLALAFPDAARLETFVTGPNAEVLASLTALAEAGAGRAVYLWGEPGSGKTHLLHALCARARPGAAGCLALAELTREQQPALLEGMESLGLLCVDDAGAVAGDREWELALFGLYNRARDAGTALVLAGREAPGGLSLALPDLRSRFLGDLVLQLRPLDDAGKAEALRRRARWRGLTLADEVVEFMLHRCSRSLADLMAVLERLDTASLASSRRITIPFVKQALEL